ncbi:hypothetical protein EYF80_062020 [Liparis tanakae]|uniref:Uncharacterized protein n=1 Tax=Liparis tanakae TaxID=230148 RepID=A0A4Z2EGC6_9TELE|nr:hypothetical protein EYF80_062020 [Liparis tanakae]
MAVMHQPPSRGRWRRHCDVTAAHSHLLLGSSARWLLGPDSAGPTLLFPKCIMGQPWKDIHTMVNGRRAERPPSARRSPPPSDPNPSDPNPEQQTGCRSR